MKRGALAKQVADSIYVGEREVVHCFGAESMKVSFCLVSILALPPEPVEILLLVKRGIDRIEIAPDARVAA